MWRAALLAIPASTLAMGLTGCTHTVTGSAMRDAAATVTGVRPGDVDRVLLGTSEVGDVARTRLQVDADRSRPIPGASAVPACSALDAVGMSPFIGDSWERFQVVLFTDGDRREQVISEAVAIYPDGASAASAFAAGTKDSSACDGQRALGHGGDAAWGFTVPVVDADAVRWRKQQIGIPMTWVCHGEARLRSNVVVQAMACRGDDSGRITVTALADRMSAAVWELSDR